MSYCHFCAEPLPADQRGIYCPGRDCKRAANNAKKNRRAQRICRLCGRGPAPYVKALRKLYAVTRKVKAALLSTATLQEVADALAEIEELRAQLKAERQKAEAHEQPIS